MGGWAKAGTALGLAMSGGDRNSSDKYQDTMLRGHRVQKALMDAEKATQEYNAAAAFDITPALPPGMEQMAPMLNNAFRAKQNPQGVIKSISDQMKNDAMASAVKAAAAGDFEGMQTQQALASGKPPERTKVVGNTMINPALSPEDQNAKVTPYGSQYIEAGTQRGIATANISAASRERVAANKPAAAGKSNADTEYSKILATAAQSALSEAKFKGLDVSGISVKDVAWQLENNGEFKDNDGTVVTRWQVDKFSDKASGTDVVSVDTSPSSAMTTDPAKKPRSAAAKRRVKTVDGRTVVAVGSPAEAKAAWAKLGSGMGLQFPNGTIKYKD